MTRHLLPLLAAGLLAAPAAGSDLKEPYKVRLVVETGKNRLLTDVFKQKVARQLADGLQAALGTLAKVEVAAKHDKLDDIRALGLDKGLNGYRARSDERTWFVKIDLVGTFYQVQTRLHDGLTGLPSPTVRQERTRDRDYVAREAALLIERDLGLLGTITSEPDGQRQVTVDLKAAGIDKADLSKWVKKGEVFSVVEVGAAGAGKVIPWTYLQVEAAPKDGSVACKFYSRYKLKSVTGLRAVLLHTRSGALRLRLREEKPGGGTRLPEVGWRVLIGRRGFDKDEATRLEADTNGRRDVDTATMDNGTLDRLAFVSVLSGETTKARVPVPVTDGGVVLLTVPASNEDEDRVLFKHRSLVRTVSDAYLVQLQMFKEINELTAKKEKGAEAMVKVRATLTRLHKDHAKLSEELEELRSELDAYKGKGRPSVAGIEARLKAIKEGEKDLTDHIAALEKIEKEEKSPEKKKWLLLQKEAERLEKEAELGQALAIYDKAPDAYKTAALEKHVAALRKLWEPKDDDHKKARAFIYDTWPKLDTSAELLDNVEKAAEALATCKKNNDKVGPAKLLKGTHLHMERVAKEERELKPETNVDDEKPAKLLLKLIPELAKLEKALKSYLGQKD